MDFSVNPQLYDTTAALRRAQAARIFAPQTKPANTDSAPQNAVTLVPEKVAQDGTKLVSERQETLNDGAFRRTRTFEREDGRQFIRVEDVVSTLRGSKKTVVQQNPSGSITRYEEILDREETGTFRRTQRFQDGNGEITTQITTGYTVTDPFVLSGGTAPLSFNAPSPFTATRGTQLDLTA